MSEMKTTEMRAGIDHTEKDQTSSFDSTDITVREMSIEDIDAIADLEARDSQTPWNRNALLTYFMRNDTVMLTVVDESNRPVGFCGLLLLTPEAEVLDITVDRALRCRGIGNRLLSEAIRLAESRGTEIVYLEVRDSNAPARHLYEKLGFEAYGRRPRYYTEPVEDAIVMKYASRS